MIQIVVAISECNPSAIEGHASMTIVLSSAPLSVPNTNIKRTIFCLESTSPQFAGM